MRRRPSRRSRLPLGCAAVGLAVGLREARRCRWAADGVSLPADTYIFQTNRRCVGQLSERRKIMHVHVRAAHVGKPATRLDERQDRASATKQRDVGEARASWAGCFPTWRCPLLPSPLQVDGLGPRLRPRRSPTHHCFFCYRPSRPAFRLPGRSGWCGGQRRRLLSLASWPPATCCMAQRAI